MSSNHDCHRRPPGVRAPAHHLRDPAQRALRRFGHQRSWRAARHGNPAGSRRRSRSCATRPRTPAPRSSARGRRGSTRPLERPHRVALRRELLRAKSIAASNTPRSTAVNIMRDERRRVEREHVDLAVPMPAASRASLQARGVALRRGHARSVPFRGDGDRSAPPTSRGRAHVDEERPTVRLVVGQRGREHVVADAEAAAEVLVAGQRGTPRRVCRRLAVASPSGSARVRVRMMSPPLPGSDVIVPHCRPPTAVANTARRCSSHAGCDASGRRQPIAEHGRVHRGDERDRRVRGRPSTRSSAQRPQRSALDDSQQPPSVNRHRARAGTRWRRARRSPPVPARVAADVRPRCGRQSAASAATRVVDRVGTAGNVHAAPVRTRPARRPVTPESGSRSSAWRALRLARQDNDGRPSVSVEAMMRPPSIDTFFRKWVRCCRAAAGPRSPRSDGPRTSSG